MADRPSLRTERLLLRPFALADAPEVQRLAGEKDIAAATLAVPHPYGDGMAESWISTHQATFDGGTQVVFAITRQRDGALVGAIGLEITREHAHAELGYWIGKPYWGQGYATEAARAAVGYGFERLGLNRIFAYHFVRNPASGRVLRKIGMTYEGCLRRHIQKWGAFEDLACYAILRREASLPS
jgi:RimJ/RimL family protein N-acetyltransferase